MNINEANVIFRKSILKHYFEPQLINMDFKRSPVRHPDISDSGLMQSELLHIFFDVETGSDYPDGDEWFIVDMLFAHDMPLPDSLKGPDYFTTISAEEEKTYWHHRELIRYKYGKSKKLHGALTFIKSKYAELHALLEPLEGDIN